MTRKQRAELRTTLDSIASNAGLALDLAYKAAQGKTEAEAVEEIGELMISARGSLSDLEQLLDEIREQRAAAAAGEARP